MTSINMKQSTIIKAIITLFLAIAMAFETSARKIDSPKGLVAYLYGCLYEAGAAADSIPAFDNAPLVRCNDEIVVNRSRLELVDLTTGQYVTSPQNLADNGIYGFYIMGQLPRQIHVFLKYGNEYTVLKPAKYGKYDMSAVKDQISIIFRHFKAVREIYGQDSFGFLLKYEYKLPVYITAVCNIYQYNSMYFDYFDNLNGQ